MQHWIWPGRFVFGPDVEWVDRVDYTVNANRRDVFYAATRKYWPGLKDSSLLPSYAGIRPKISGPGAEPADFSVQGSEIHGIISFWNLFGIESPGLTSSLAVAEMLVAQSVSGL